MKDQVQEQSIEFDMKMRLQQVELQRQREHEELLAKKKKEQFIMDHNKNAKSIREANEICKLMGKNIKFRQILVQSIFDRKNSDSFDQSPDDLVRRDSTLSMSAFQQQEELQI